jgi:hypothetical protein
MNFASDQPLARSVEYLGKEAEREAKERSIWESKKEVWFASFLKDAELRAQQQREHLVSSVRELSEAMELHRQQQREREENALKEQNRALQSALQQQQEQHAKVAQQQSEWRNVVWSEEKRKTNKKSI